MRASIVLPYTFLKNVFILFYTIGNSEVIAIDQDPLGIPGELVYSSLVPLNMQQIWTRSLYGGAYAAVLFNRDDTEAVNVVLLWSMLPLAQVYKTNSTNHPLS